MAVLVIKRLALPTDYSIPLLCAATGLPMVLFECYYRQPRRNANGDFTAKPAHPSDMQRLLIKLTGFGAVLGLLVIWFYVVPYYQTGAFTWIRKGAIVFAPAVLPIGAVYVAWIDRRLTQPFDGAWHAGALLLRPFKTFTNSPIVQTKAAAQFAMGWFIKAFFFVFLVNILPNNIEFIRVQAFDPWSSVFRFVFVLTTVLFTVDVVIALIGYVCTFKPLGAHIRSPNNRVIGWLAALSCYPPFVLIGGSALLDYRNGGVFWDQWLQPSGIHTVWAIAVIACLLLYVWATLAFGIRFSNLTNRGTLTHGPYRLFRHPAYVAKNIYWWLIFVPWINTINNTHALINTVLLLALTGIYAVRAKTEEAHLLEDSDYQAYVAWFDSHNLWQRIVCK